MAGFKAGRMSEDIRRIISAKMRELKDPRLHGGQSLTVVRCDVAGDGSYAKVYISSFEGEEASKQAVKVLESAKGLLKKEVSRVLGLKKCPELKFVADDSAAHSAHISRLLKELVPEENGESEQTEEDEE